MRKSHIIFWAIASYIFLGTFRYVAARNWEECIVGFLLAGILTYLGYRSYRKTKRPPSEKIESAHTSTITIERYGQEQEQSQRFEWYDTRGKIVKVFQYYPNIEECFMWEMKYHYPNVEIESLGNSIPNLHSPVEIRFAGDKAQVLSEGRLIGYINQPTLARMVNDFQVRGEQVKALIDNLNPPSLFLCFYKRELTLEEKIARRNESMDFRLSGNKSEKMQSNLLYVTVGDEVSLGYDGETDKYSITDDLFSVYGYLPRSAAAFIDSYEPDEIIAVIKEIYTDDDLNYGAVVTLYK